MLDTVYGLTAVSSLFFSNIRSDPSCTKVMYPRPWKILPNVLSSLSLNGFSEVSVKWFNFKTAWFRKAFSVLFCLNRFCSVE